MEPDLPRASADNAAFGDDNPEWTEADFAAARPARDVLGDSFVDSWETTRELAQPADPVLLPHELMVWFRAQGGDWRARIVAALEAHIARETAAAE